MLFVLEIIFFIIACCCAGPIGGLLYLIATALFGISYNILQANQLKAAIELEKQKKHPIE